MKKFLIGLILGVFTFSVNFSFASIANFAGSRGGNNLVNNSLDAQTKGGDLETVLNSRETYFNDSFKAIEDYIKANLDDEDVDAVLALTQATFNDIISLVDDAMTSLKNGEEINIDSLYRQVLVVLTKYAIEIAKYVDVQELLDMVNELIVGLSDIVHNSNIDQYVDDETYNELLIIINSRDQYLTQGLEEIEQYLEENISDEESDDIMALTEELLSEVQDLITESVEDVENGDYVDMTALEKELMTLISRYLFKMNKYVDVEELLGMVEEFVAGFDDLLQENKKSRSTIQQNTYENRINYYNLLYSKLETIVKKFPADKADDVLLMLEKKLYALQSDLEGNDDINAEKKTKMLELYEILIWAVQDLQESYNIDLNDVLVSSISFDDGDMIPLQFTCEGEDISPQLSIKGFSSSGKYVALIVDDPDAPKGTWNHYLLANVLISGDTLIIPENFVPVGAVVGKNSSGKNQRNGPCPPSGVHRYYFKVYEFSKKLDLQQGFTKEKLLNEFDKYGIGYGEMIGLYEKMN